MLLSGKTAIITGAASGVGRATALVYSEEGASVCLVDVDRPGAVHTLKEIEKNGGKAVFVPGDVSSSADMKACAAKAIAEFGKIDTLVNNAAVALLGTVADLSESDWQRTLDVNLTGIYQLSRFVIPEMIRNGGGVILNISSITGLVAVRNHAAYCASKGGVIALTRAMAVDHASKGIRVNAICPSGIDTPQMDAFFAHQPDPKEAIKETIAKHPIGRMAKPQELARLLVFLATEEASYITGSIYTFDGGYTAIR